MSYTVSEIAGATGGSLIRGSADCLFGGVSTDSRKIREGDLFIPLAGPKYDGHDFLAAAAGCGAAGLLIKRGEEERLRGIGEGITVLAVGDTLQALGDLAHFHRERWGGPVLAITGSAGKTTTKEMAAAVLGLMKKTLKTEGNLNNLVGLPLTLFGLQPEHEAAIVEMGTNVLGEIARLSGIAAPDAALITNVGPAHLEGLKTVETVRREKGELFRHVKPGGTIIVNNDDEAVRSLADGLESRKVTFGIRTPADVGAEEIRFAPVGTTFRLRTGAIAGEVAINATGVHNVMNALAAAAAGMAMGASMEDICRGLGAFRPVSGRMEIGKLKNGVFLMDDTYNANPISVREALATLKSLRGPGRSAVILGDMLELGEQAESLHEEMGALIAETGVDRVLLQGNFARFTAAGAERGGLAPERIFFPSTAGDIVEQISGAMKAGDWVLVKGSRGMKMEGVVRALRDAFGLDYLQ